MYILFYTVNEYYGVWLFMIWLCINRNVGLCFVFTVKPVICYLRCECTEYVMFLYEYACVHDL